MKSRAWLGMRLERVRRCRKDIVGSRVGDLQGAQMWELLHANGERVFVSRGITRRGTLDVSLIIMIPDLIGGTGENIEFGCGSDSYTRTTVTGRGRIRSSEDGGVQAGAVFAGLSAFVGKHCVSQSLR
jgi:hypothetical protein